MDFFRELQAKGQNNGKKDNIQWDKFMPKQCGLDMNTGTISKVIINSFVLFYILLIIIFVSLNKYFLKFYIL